MIQAREQIEPEGVTRAKYFRGEAEGKGLVTLCFCFGFEALSLSSGFGDVYGKAKGVSAL